MTLVYLDFPADGDLVVPPGRASIDPLLAEAVWWIDASDAPDGANLGTAGSDLDGMGVLWLGDGEIAAGPYTSEAAAATCPDANDLDLTAGFCVAVDVTTDWRPSIPQQILAKPRTGDPDTEDAYAVGFDSNGVLFVEWHDGTGGHNGPGFVTGNGADVTYTNPDGVARRQFVYEFVADNGLGGWTARLYTGTPEDRTLVSTMENTTDGAQSIVTSTADLRVGDPCNGLIHRVRLYDELDGTLLRDFHPAEDWTSGTTMTSSATGEVWSSVSAVEGPAFGALTVPDDSALDIAADASATLAFWFTQPNVANVDGEVYRLALREEGTIGAGGTGLVLIDIKIAAFASDFAGAAVSDGTNTGFALGAHWSAGTHVAILVINRDTDVATLYIDGASHATADISAVGAIDPAADLVLGVGAHRSAAKWDRVLDVDEMEHLEALW